MPRNATLDEDIDRRLRDNQLRWPLTWIGLTTSSSAVREHPARS